MDLETVEMIMAIEEEFMIEILDSVAERIVSIADLRAVVEAELERYKRNTDADSNIDRIADIAARFAHVGKDSIGLETKLIEDLGLK